MNAKQLKKSFLNYKIENLDYKTYLLICKQAQQSNLVSIQNGELKRIYKTQCEREQQTQKIKNLLNTINKEIEKC